MQSFLRHVYPYNGPGGNFLYDLLGILFVCAFFDFKHVRRLRNLDVVMLCAWVPLGYYESGNLAWTMVLGYLPLLYFLPRLLYQVWRKHEDPCVINFSSRALIVMTVVFFIALCVLCFAWPTPFPDEEQSDTAQSGMAGGRLLLQGKIPYGNLYYGWDSYPPTYYYVYALFEWIVSDPRPVTDHARPFATYGLSARLLTCVLNLGCMIALVALGTRMRDRKLGYALAFAWAVLPYTYMSTTGSQTGHLMPGVFTVFALLALTIAPLAGAVMLAILTTVGFYPVFYIPVWAAHVRRRKAISFLLVVTAVGLALWLPMLFQEQGVQKFFEAVLQHDARQRFSPWDQHPWTDSVRAALTLALPAFVGFATWAAWRRPGFVRLLALTGTVVVWVQMIYRNAPGRYHLWMIPCLMPLLLFGGTRAAFEAHSPPPESSRGLDARIS